MFKDTKNIIIYFSYPSPPPPPTGFQSKRQVALLADMVINNTFPQPNIKKSNTNYK